VYKFSSLLLLLFALFSQAKSVDPTKPFSFSGNVTTKAIVQDSLVLQAIVEQGEKKIAVISGKVLHITDPISQYHLSKITKNYVVLSSPEKNLKLTLFSPVVAK